MAADLPKITFPPSPLLIKEDDAKKLIKKFCLHACTNAHNRLTKREIRSAGKFSVLALPAPVYAEKKSRRKRGKSQVLPNCNVIGA